MIEVHIPRDLDEDSSLRPLHKISLLITTILVIPLTLTGIGVFNIPIPQPVIGLLIGIIALIGIAPFGIDMMSKSSMLSEDIILNFILFQWEIRTKHYEPMDYISEIDDILTRNREKRLKKQWQLEATEAKKLAKKANKNNKLKKEA